MPITPYMSFSVNNQWINYTLTHEHNCLSLEFEFFVSIHIFVEDMVTNNRCNLSMFGPWVVSLNLRSVDMVVSRSPSRVWAVPSFDDSLRHLSVGIVRIIHLVPVAIAVIPAFKLIWSLTHVSMCASISPSPPSVMDDVSNSPLSFRCFTTSFAVDGHSNDAGIVVTHSGSSGIRCSCQPLVEEIPLMMKWSTDLLWKTKAAVQCISPKNTILIWNFN